MHPLVKAAALVAVAASLPPPAAAPPRAAPGPSGAPLEPAVCPPRALPSPDGGPCLPLPSPAERRLARLPRLELHPEREGIARLPGRPESYLRYVLPVSPALAITPGGDDGSNRPRLGVQIDTEHLSPVTLARLEGEVGKPSVVLVGELYGVTVVARHQVEIGGVERDYLSIYGGLDRPGPRVVNGATLDPMAVIGFVGQGPRGPSLYFETRRLHRPLEAAPPHLSRLVSAGVSVVEDARNLLPLAP